jgi:4-diphosphocytidyl-2-C-methyl-D-erythritol kinase
MQAISLADQISATTAATNIVQSNDSALENDDNLALRAANLWTERLDPSKRSLAISMQKSIPIAAGLGGASSNAATVLMLARSFFDASVADSDLDSAAASLGSDVPFFLHSTAALASGRGEVLDPLPPLASASFVLVTPKVEIARKTVTMYGQLRLDDFSDGSGIASLAARMAAGKPLESGDLINAFERPLLHLLPDLEGIPSIMRSLCGHGVGLSGAGPTWYAVVDSPDEANRLAASLRERLLNVRVEIAQALTDRPEIEILDDRNDVRTSRV